MTIRTTFPDGKVVDVSYWHLAERSKNPYTTQLKLDDEIQAGQIIGIVGRTGNAYNKKPHLHLKIYVQGTDAKVDKINDPFNYIYTKYNEFGYIIRDC